MNDKQIYVPIIIVLGNTNNFFEIARKILGASVLKNIKVLIPIIFFPLMSTPQERNDYPFILNNYNSNEDTFAVKVDYSYNNLGNAWFLMKEFDYFEPTIKRNTYFYSYDIMFFYNRFWIKMGSLMKKYTSGGTYSKGWDNIGNKILEYDESKAITYINKEIYFAINVVPFVRRYYDLGFTYNSISHVAGVIISKSFNHFTYTINFSKNWFMWATFKLGGLYAMSISYKPMFDSDR